MHELAITEDVLRIVVEHAERARARRVTDIYITVGDLSSVVDDSVQFYFDYLSPGTLAQGATLHFIRLPARLRCHTCQQEFEPKGLDWLCPRCGALGGEVVSGREFYIDSIEVE